MALMKGLSGKKKRKRSLLFIQRAPLSLFVVFFSEFWRFGVLCGQREISSNSIEASSQSDMAFSSCLVAVAWRS